MIAKKPKDKRCRECKQLFTPTYSTTQVVCSVYCGSKQARLVTKKAIAKKATERRKETLEMKKAAKGLPEYKKDLETHAYWNYVKFALTARYPTIKLHVFEIKEAIIVASAIVKELKKENKIYNAEERLKLRAKYNKQINLYW